MKRYYIHYWNDFGNTYNLYWADEEHGEIVPKGYERITRKEALSKARAESRRRQFDQAFSGYADDAICPIDYDENVNLEGYYPGAVLEPGEEPRILEYVNRDKYVKALNRYNADKAAGRIW